MYLVSKLRNFCRGVAQSWGNSLIKRMMWNKEFSEGRWDCIAETPGDCVYEYIEKYSQNGSILDLGCGSGNTGNELDYSKYQSYTGVDISDIALQKAIDRSERTGRSIKNRYVHSDITSYTPRQTYEVILFRESINYVPGPRIRGMLLRYRRYLDKDGVFIVRIYDRHRHSAILETIKESFQVIDEFTHEDGKTIVIVFR